MTNMTKEKEIGGVKFVAAPFTAVEGLKLKSYLLRTFGPALGQTLGAFKDLFKGDGLSVDQIGDVAIDGSSISQAIEKLVETLSEENFITFLRRMLCNVTATVPGGDGKPTIVEFSGNSFDASMELAFAGRLFSVYPVIVLVLQVNYPDFFGKTAQAIGSRIKAIASSKPASAAEQNE